MNTEELKQQLADIDELVKTNVITEVKGELWKNRIISEFEASQIPAERPRELPNDLAHLPGRMVGGGIELLKAFARGSGKTYEKLQEQEMKRSTGKSVVELYEDLNKKI